MRNIIKLVLFFITLQLNAQQDFEGVWQSNENEDSILVLYVEENNVKLWNYELNKEFHIVEQVIQAEPDHIHTYYQDVLNGYDKKFWYDLRDKNTLRKVCEDTFRTTTYKKINK